MLRYGDPFWTVKGLFNTGRAHGNNVGQWFWHKSNGIKRISIPMQHFGRKIRVLRGAVDFARPASGLHTQLDFSFKY
jgi:hypothetical protein